MPSILDDLMLRACHFGVVKNIDILTIFALIFLNEDDPALKKISDVTELTISQTFDSIERLKSQQIIYKKNKRIDFEQLENFFIHALPFMLPGEVMGLGVGAALSISETNIAFSASLTKSVVWVWPSEKGSAEGLLIKPFFENMDRFLSSHPQFYEPLSCLEILRFHKQSCRPQAVEKIKNWIHSMALSQVDIEENKTAPDIDLLCKIFAETGFRNMNFFELGKKINVPVESLSMNYQSMRGIQKKIGETCAARAYAHLGQALSAPEDKRLESIKQSLIQFFDYLDVNEEYFRLGLWFYLEKIFEKTNNAGVLQDRFFESLEDYFDKIPSQKSKQARAVLFANSWLTYAWFRWVEAPRMFNQEKASQRLQELKLTLVNQLI